MNLAAVNGLPINGWKVVWRSGGREQRGVTKGTERMWMQATGEKYKQNTNKMNTPKR